MSSVTSSNFNLGEPLLQERVKSGAFCSGKVLSLFALLIGLGFAVTLSMHRNVHESATTMAYLSSAPGLQGNAPGFAGARPAMSSLLSNLPRSYSQGGMTRDQVPGRLRGFVPRVSSNDENNEHLGINDMNILRKRMAELKARKEDNTKFKDLDLHDMAVLRQRIREQNERQDQADQLSSDDRSILEEHRAKDESTFSSNEMSILQQRMNEIKEGELKAELQTPATQPEDEWSHDMSILRKRISIMKERDVGKLNMIVADTFPLPGQRMKMKLPSSDNVRMNAKLGVVGIWPPNSGQVLPLGTEMEITSMSSAGGDGMVEVQLTGIRRFQMEGELETEKDGLTAADVEFMGDAPLGEKGELTPETLVKSDALGPLVEEWIGLVKRGNFEQQKDQISKILSQLGPMPPTKDTARRAMWVCALLNPTPALGVAYEVRPALLMAKNSAEMLSIATYGLTTSVESLKQRIVLKSASSMR